MKSLIVSGGGAKSSHSVGVALHLLRDLETCYDSFHGVSAGAIISSYLAQYPKGQEKEAGQNLYDLWSTISTEKIYKRWQPFGKFHSLWRNSVYDSSPLQKLIQENISLDKIRANGKIVTVGAISLNSGKYHTIDQTNDDFIDFVIASSSFPGMLLPIEIDGQLYSDGGVKSVSPTKVAIDFGATDIDLLITSPEIRVPYWVEKPGVIDILKRALDVSTDKILSNDTERLLIYNKLAASCIGDKKVINLNIFRPDYNLIEDLLDFNPVKIKYMLNLGYQDAKKNIKK